MTGQELTGEIKRLGKILQARPHQREHLRKPRSSSRPDPTRTPKSPSPKRTITATRSYAEYHSDLTKDPFIAAQIVDNPGAEFPERLFISW